MNNIKHDTMTHEFTRGTYGKFIVHYNTLPEETARVSG
jgi:hypothetical protein